ncbi:MAG: hypothetical protein BWY07_02003 [Candidatus Hydrogenedentes bacterium ADurb.Bin170]|nr:MAG: hypothetical protein BWY07_02003 [Candidatus Hydrogenedentes bacterium ADurb.Bin170]
MSGGSFNYLCYKDETDLFASEKELEHMADALAKVGYADDAAKETLWLLLHIRQQRIRINVVISRLSGVWHDMEWWQDGDIGEDRFKKTLAEYRRENPEEPGKIE